MEEKVGEDITTKSVSEEESVTDLSGMELPETKKPMRPIVLVGSVVGGLLILFVLIALIFPKKQGGGDIGPSPTPMDLSRYSQDEDGDKLPDFVEQIIGFDPNDSELDRCYRDKCTSRTITDAEVKALPRNVIILLDASGSMEQKAGEESKISSAKLAIQEYLKKTATTPMTKVGLAVYGYAGSNAQTDKNVSCQSAEMRVPLGELTLGSADEPLSKIEPVGWTPIGLGLRSVKDSFSDKIGEINEVVVISDGIETCDTNPIAAAKELFEIPAHIIVHVIGFAVGETDAKALKEISDDAGGTYATAPTIDELKLAMDLQWENYVRRAREEACKISGGEAYYACKEEVLTMMRAYVSAQLSKPLTMTPYEEKKKVDRMRWVVESYVAGRMLEQGITADQYLRPIVSPTPR
jgi:hypothetical protein